MDFDLTVEQMEHDYFIPDLDAHIARSIGWTNKWYSKSWFIGGRMGEPST
jgi:hypothetical protein